MKNNELTTVFTADHAFINQLFIEKIIAMLTDAAKVQKAYSLAESYGYVVESLKLDIDGTELTLQTQRKV